VIALPLGIFAAIYQYSKQDYLINSFAFLGISMPSFWFGLMCSLLAMKTKWLPSSGMNSAEIADLGSWVDSARHLVLPAIVLAYYEIAILIRYMRTSMLEVKNQDFIRTARAKGLDEDMVIFKHALRNALIPVITVLAASMPFLFSGALITETIFSWDGVGNMLYEAVMQKDTNVVMPTFMLITFLTMLFTLVADVLYACVDPRIQYS
jgi:peptide/nickel transport system permease protein